MVLFVVESSKSLSRCFDTHLWKSQLFHVGIRDSEKSDLTSEYVFAPVNDYNKWVYLTAAENYFSLRQELKEAVKINHNDISIWEISLDVPRIVGEVMENKNKLL